MKVLEDFIRPTQKQLFNKLCNKYGDKAFARTGCYILVEGDAPVMLLAHLDTVHDEQVMNLCTTKNGNILMSPQGIGGDDRCGVYALASVYDMADVKPWLLFTCDEEVGGIGASVFCKDYRKGRVPKLDNLKYLVEIDRKGENDAVYYDCENDEFEDYITSKGFKTGHGSFSDISLVAPALEVAAVNLSSGYYNAHTLHEYINRRQIDAVIQRVIEMVNESVNGDIPRYEYVEAQEQFWGCRAYYGVGASYGSYRTSSNDRTLRHVPKEIRDEYTALLDYYTEKELEKMRVECGDGMIPMLFESEFGSWDEYMDTYGEYAGV